MEYILDSNDYVEEISFGASISSKGIEGTEYTGTVPEGYETLEEWASSANIRAYKITEGNLIYDENRDRELQQAWEEEASYNTPEIAGNKTRTIDATSTDTQYPSAKAVFDALANMVQPTYHSVSLNADGTVDTYASTLIYNSVKANLTNPKEADYLDVVWNATRFYAKCIEVTDVNNGDLKFIGEVEYQGMQRYIVFTLTPNNVLTTTNIITFESVSNKKNSIINNLSNDYYPSTNAVYNEFQRKPVVVWETDTNFLNAIQADITENPAWQLTGLDMTPFKRIKIYSKAGKGRTTAGATGGMILEMSLDDRAGFADYGGNFVGSVLVQKPNDANRYASLTCAVSADKTKFVVLRQTSLYGTAATTNNDIGADVYMIEGYYD